jgi:hypothetical protein
MTFSLLVRDFFPPTIKACRGCALSRYAGQLTASLLCPSFGETCSVFPFIPRASRDPELLATLFGRELLIRKQGLGHGFSLVRYRWRLPVRARARAAFTPACTRSGINPRSNSASAPEIGKLRRPLGVVVSTWAGRERKPPPRSSRCRTVSLRWDIERPRRSGVPMSSASLVRQPAHACTSPGRSVTGTPCLREAGRLCK